MKAGSLQIIESTKPEFGGKGDISIGKRSVIKSNSTELTLNIKVRY